eukprot:CAMPEP_0194174070 /NCGR_PEP_ID=MMETSP0154-20130528/8334_1 /TAXON_ID=1049557 /ORGANISM="Thalassiothrix antarctica, Strain L6-D1" /LENGTH=269 /DNA_ID=CAMNT_0038887387 /DNA_START=41 /DNA_END=850 /DNA_ORIENTATION=-
MVEASLIVSPSKEELPSFLNAEVIKASKKAIAARNAFTIALSGGSLPSFLSSLPSMSENPIMFDKWHVLLADERCVPSTDDDSNLGSLREKLLSKVSIPESQVYGINESKLKEENGPSMIADEYEDVVKKVINEYSDGKLDLAVLGIGPDGHTCSLFPGHSLLDESERWVTYIMDSPKPPPERITLTFPFLNDYTRKVLFCGAGSSKAPILREIFSKVTKNGDSNYEVVMKDPPPYPCASIKNKNLLYIVDKDATVCNSNKYLPTLLSW